MADILFKAKEEKYLIENGKVEMKIDGEDREVSFKIRLSDYVYLMKFKEDPYQLVEKFAKEILGLDIDLEDRDNFSNVWSLFDQLGEYVKEKTPRK